MVSQVNQKKKILKYWKIISRYKTHLPGDYLIQLYPNHKESNFDLNREDFRKIFSKEKRKLKEIIQNAYEIRQEFLISQGELYVELHKISKEAAVKQVKQHEKSRKTHSTIGRALGNKSSNSLSKILVPENSDSIKESYDALKNQREDITKWR